VIPASEKYWSVSMTWPALFVICRLSVSMLLASIVSWPVGAPVLGSEVGVASPVRVSS
jgi:hypothetical protein